MATQAHGLVFWGTPDIAADCVRALIDAGEEITGVVTQPDKPTGRSQTMTAPAVKTEAEAHGIESVQPRTLKDGETLKWLAARSPEMCVVVAYGKIIPSELLNIPRYFLNLHFSLLPQYRGAAPVQRALMDGCEITGVTVQHLAPELDTGAVIAQTEVRIAEDDTTGSLLAKCVVAGAPLLVETVKALRAGTAARVEQDHTRATYAAKLTKADGAIDWSRPARAIHNRVRACNPWPGAYTRLGGATVKIWRSTVAGTDNTQGRPGDIELRDKHLYVHTGGGIVELLELQPAGRGRMAASAFIAGRDVQGARFE